MAYSDEEKESKLNAIFKSMEDGASLRSALIEIKLSQTTFFSWIDNNEALLEQYARAREARTDKMADEILEIADSSEGDLYVDDNGDTKIDGNTVQRARTQIDARKWLMSKMSPKKYGDKIQVGGDENNPINVKFDITKVYREDQ